MTSLYNADPGNTIQGFHHFTVTNPKDVRNDIRREILLLPMYGRKLWQGL